MSSPKQRRAVEVGVPVPPPDPRPYVPHIRLPGNRETSFLALHDSVVGVPMHWVENQHYPHVKDRQWCAGCRLGQTPRWTGYLGVISLNTANRFVLSIPPAAFRNAGHFRDRSDAGTLAGLVFTAYRFGAYPAKTNPAVIELVEHPLPYPRVHPFPLLAALSRYWNRDSLDGIEFIKRPEDLEQQLAKEFIQFAEVVKQHQAQRKAGAS